MNYEIIQIQRDPTTGMEVAYLYDRAQGKVLKLPVEDRIEYAPAPHIMHTPRYTPPVYAERDAQPYRPPANMIPPGFRGNAPAREIVSGQIPPVKTELPDKPPPLRPPPHLAGVFGGTAEEKRTA